MELFLQGLYTDAKKNLKENTAVERETVFKFLKEFAFTIHSDFFLKTYRNAITFLMNEFIEKDKKEISLLEFTKNIQTRLNYFKILSEFNDAEIIYWQSSTITKDYIPSIIVGEVLKNLKKLYLTVTVQERAEQRFGHALAFYSCLPLFIKYGASKTRDDVKLMNIVPKKPWLMLLSLLVDNDNGEIRMEKTRKILNQRRSDPKIYGTLVSNLNSLSADHFQKLIENIEEDENEKKYILSHDITQYIQNIRVNLRERRL
jgi:hypothetical protein